MRACDRKWQRHDHFLPVARIGFRFRLTAADPRNESCFAQYYFESAAFVATEKKSCERVLQIAFGLFAGMALRMDVEQVA